MRRRKAFVRTARKCPLTVARTPIRTRTRTRTRNRQMLVVAKRRASIKPTAKEFPNKQQARTMPKLLPILLKTQLKLLARLHDAKNRCHTHIDWRCCAHAWLALVLSLRRRVQPSD